MKGIGFMLTSCCLLAMAQAELVPFDESTFTNKEPIYAVAQVQHDKLVALSGILAAPEQYLEQEVTVQGTITAVCEKMQCWMRFATAENEPAFRLKVRDGDMVFPLSAKGKTAYATGLLQPWPGGEDARYQLVPSAVSIVDAE